MLKEMCMKLHEEDTKTSYFVVKPTVMACSFYRYTIVNI